MGTPAQVKLAYLLDEPQKASCEVAQVRHIEAEQTHSETEILKKEIRRLERLLKDKEGNVSNGCVLGIDSSKTECACCGSEEKVIRNRAFVEEQALYCSDCWDRYERCGYWGPTLRVNTRIPPRNEDGIPQYGAEDCFIVPELVCARDDLSLSEQLCASLPEGKQFSDWHGARHHAVHLGGDEAERFRDPSSNVPPAWQETVKMLETSFGVRAAALRLNLYRGNADWKPLHHDRGQDEAGIPQMTVMVSLGVTRELVLMHKKTGITSSFPLSNGDVFVFTPETNWEFLHGISKVKDPAPGTGGVRLSFVIWGPRVDMNGDPFEKPRSRYRNNKREGNNGKYDRNNAITSGNNTAVPAARSSLEAKPVDQTARVPEDKQRPDTKGCGLM